MTLAIPISPQAEQRLGDKAKALGLDLPTFISRMVEAEAQRPSLIELSGEVFENFKRSALTDEELTDLLEKEKHDERAARRGAPFAE